VYRGCPETESRAEGAPNLHPQLQRRPAGELRRRFERHHRPRIPIRYTLDSFKLYE